MAYPGDSYTMANYGLKDLSPAEKTGYWKEYVRDEKKIFNKHIAIKGNGTDVWPGILEKQEQLQGDLRYRSYYEEVREHDHVCGYDRLFHIEEGYNSKLHRDDRKHADELDIHSEEQKRRVPVLSSSDYGRRVHNPLEPSSRKFSRIEKVMKGFYRSRGTGIPTSQD